MQHRLSVAAQGGDSGNSGSSRDDKADPKKQKEIQEYVEALQRGGMKKEMAQEVLKKWEEAGGDTDPNTLRKLFLRQSAIPAVATIIQTLVDAAASYSIYTSAVFFSAGPEFFGRDVLVFLLNALAAYFALGVGFDVATLIAILVSTARTGTSIDSFYAALKTIAGPSPASGLVVVDKAQVAVNALKVVQTLDAIARMIESGAKDGSVKESGSSTLANLSAYLTLYRSETRDNFDSSKVGMTEAEASDLALQFGRFDLNDDGRLDTQEVRAMAGQLGIDLSSEEASAAIKVMDKNSDGLIEFSEFAGWWAERTGKAKAGAQ